MYFVCPLHFSDPGLTFPGDGERDNKDSTEGQEGELF